MLTVQKFGGSSLASAERIRRAAGIIASARASGADVVAVLSARGGTTDELMADALELSPAPDTRELDVLLSTGELCSVALMAMTLKRLGCDCISLSGRQAGILTDTQHGSAHIKAVHTQRILRELEHGKAVIVAGFQGIDENDDITTLGRGGSDTTAVALAAALHADRCEIYSDVDGIYTADPRLVTGAKKLDVIDSYDMLKLARGGSQVLHSRSVEAAIRYDIPVYLLSSFRSVPGTLMTHISDKSPLPSVTGITRDESKNRISIVGHGADGELSERLRSVLRDKGISVLSSGIGDGIITFDTPENELLPALELIHRECYE